MTRPPFKFNPVALAAWMYCQSLAHPSALARWLAYIDARSR